MADALVYLPLLDAALALAALGLAGVALAVARRLPTRPELADVRQRVAVLTGLTEDAAAEIGRLRATQDGLARRLALAEDAAEAASINTALGVANDSQFATAKATYNPLAIGPSITIPWALWYNSDDTTVPAADVVALAATNSTYITATNRGTGGHDFNNVTGADVHGWLEGLSW